VIASPTIRDANTVAIKNHAANGGFNTHPTSGKHATTATWGQFTPLICVHLFDFAFTPLIYIRLFDFAICPIDLRLPVWRLRR